MKMVYFTTNELCAVEEEFSKFVSTFDPLQACEKMPTRLEFHVYNNHLQDELIRIRDMFGVSAKLKPNVRLRTYNRNAPIHEPARLVGTRNTDISVDVSWSVETE